MLALEAAEQKRKDQAHELLVNPNTIIFDDEYPPTSMKEFRQHYRVNPKFRLNVDEHQ